MNKRYFLGMLALLILLVFACAPQQPEQPEIKVPAPSIKTVTIHDIVDNPNEFVDVKVQVTGKLIFTGKNYFTDPKFEITDGANNFSVSVWVPLEVSLPIPETPEKESLPPAMSNYIDKTITIQGVIIKSNEQFYLDVIKAIIIEPPKGGTAIKIVSPGEGDLIKSSKVTVQVDAENFNIVPVNQPVKDNEGHFHIWLDSEKKVTPDKIVTFENVVSGKHAIVAELVKSNHSSLSPKVTKTININVESDFVPKAEQVQQQAGISEFTVEVDDNGFYPNTLQAKINDTVKINFKFKDDSIYFAGLDVKGPFPTLHYKLKGQQPLTASFVMKEAARIDSYWPSSGVHKATLNVEVAK